MTTTQTYTATLPNGETVTTTSKRAIRWATILRFEGETEWRHFGWSSATDHKGGVKAGRSTNPYAAEYDAIPATPEQVGAPVDVDNTERGTEVIAPNGRVYFVNDFDGDSQGNDFLWLLPVDRKTNRRRRLYQSDVNAQGWTVKPAATPAAEVEPALAKASDDDPNVQLWRRLVDTNKVGVAYLDATKNATDTARERGFSLDSPEWYQMFAWSYENAINAAATTAARNGEPTPAEVAASGIWPEPRRRPRLTNRPAAPRSTSRRTRDHGVRAPASTAAERSSWRPAGTAGPISRPRATAPNARRRRPSWCPSRPRPTRRRAARWSTGGTAPHGR